MIYFFHSIEASLFVNKSIGELLFEGYEDQLLAIAEWAGQKSRTPLDKMGWFYKVNYTVFLYF